MFDSLDEQMKHDEEEGTTKRERFLKWATIVVISLVLFGGLYVGLRLFQHAD